MRSAYLTILGMYQYDNTVFDKLVIPNTLDREVLINLLLDQCGNLETHLPNPDYFKSMCGYWSRSMLPIWEKLEETLYYEYNPIHNYDRKEEHSWSEKHGLSEDTQEDVGRNKTENITETGNSDTTRTERETSDTDRTLDENVVKNSNSTGTTTDKRTGQTTEKIAAFDQTLPEPAYSPRTLTETEEDYSSQVVGDVDTTEKTDVAEQTNYTRNMNGSEEYSRNLNTKRTGSESEDRDSTRKLSEDTTHTETLRAYGNIGVTTTQQMIESQRELVRFNLYQTVIEDFTSRFCLLVY